MNRQKSFIFFLACVSTCQGMSLLDFLTRLVQETPQFRSLNSPVDPIHEHLHNPDVNMYNDKFGGDVLVDELDARALEETPLSSAIAPGVKYTYWPGGIIYYEIHKSLENERPIILDAMNEYHKHTCIRWTDRKGNPKIKNYALIRGDKKGCWSFLGMRKKEHQEVSIANPGCLFKGIIMHELMHVVGFLHEHQRFDRDKHIKIHLNNVAKDRWHNFRKADLRKSRDLKVPYDLDSVMHYELTAFSKNGKRTMEPIGQLKGKRPGRVYKKNFMSSTDIRKIKKLYKCH